MVILRVVKALGSMKITVIMLKRLHCVNIMLDEIGLCYP
jgi:hypothetical protein